jgi:hypothetical protein
MRAKRPVARAVRLLGLVRFGLPVPPGSYTPKCVLSPRFVDTCPKMVHLHIRCLIREHFARIYARSCWNRRRFGSSVTSPVEVSAFRAVPIVYPMIVWFVNIDVKLGGIVVGSSLGVVLTGASIVVNDTALTLDVARSQRRQHPRFPRCSQPRDSVTADSAERSPSYSLHIAHGK